MLLAEITEEFQLLQTRTFYSLLCPIEHGQCSGPLTFLNNKFPTNIHNFQSYAVQNIISL